MNVPKAFFYCAFANDPNRPLPTLTDEYQFINSCLQELHGGANFNVDHYIESFITPNILVKDLSKFRESITFFHFSGHAGTDLLSTGQGHAYAEGIAEMIKNCKQIQCVILNGCSTGPQADGLLKNGVPVVIGTSAPVGDSIAYSFSKAFYDELAMGNTILEAFNNGVAQCKVFKRNLVVEKIDRSVGFSASSSDRNIWGLYFQKEEDLGWRLPLKSAVTQEATSTNTVISGTTFNVTGGNINFGNQIINKRE